MQLTGFQRFVLAQAHSAHTCARTVYEVRFSLRPPQLRVAIRSVDTSSKALSCERKSLEKLATQHNHARRYTNMAKKVLLVSTSAGQMGEHPTGLWISELAEPYTVFTKAGFDVTIASIAGGAEPICA